MNKLIIILSILLFSIGLNATTITYWSFLGIIPLTTPWGSDKITSTQAYDDDYIIAITMAVNSNINVKSLTINTGKTLTINGSATIQNDLTINGTFNVTGNLTVGGQIISNSGTLNVNGGTLNLSASAQNISAINVTNGGLLYIGRGTYGTITVDGTSRVISTGGGVVSNLNFAASSNNALVSFTANGYTTIVNLANFYNTLVINDTVKIVKSCTINGNCSGTGNGIFYVADGANFVNYASNFAVVQHYIKTWSLESYAFVSIPFDNQIHDFPKKTYSYIELNDSLTVWNKITKGASLQRGVGYSAFAVGTHTFKGYTNLNSVTLPITYTTNSKTASEVWGCNLVGNPYACPISYAKFISANTTIHEAIAFWDDGGTNDGRYRAGDYIIKNMLGASGGARSSQFSGDNLPSFQAFFVRALSNSSVNFNSAMLLVSASNSNYLKYEIEKIPTIRISLSNDGLYNDILIGLTSENAEGYFDALKLKGNPDFAFSTKSKTEDLAITTHSFETSDTVIVPLSIDITKADTLNLKITDFSISTNVSKIVLRDKISKIEIEIITNTDVPLIINSSNYNYELLFLKETTVDDNSDNNTIIIDNKIDDVVNITIKTREFYSIFGQKIIEIETKKYPIVIEKLTYTDGSQTVQILNKKR